VPLQGERSALFAEAGENLPANEDTTEWWMTVWPALTELRWPEGLD
jgi:hypothetical protein